MTHCVIQSAMYEGVIITLGSQGNIKIKGEPERVKKWLPHISECKHTIIAYLEEHWVNKYCDEQTFKLYGNKMVQEWGLVRVYEIHDRARSIGIEEDQAWEFADAVAVLEFGGDNRRACLECGNFQIKRNFSYGVCRVAGQAPLQNMTHGGCVSWDWLNRCPMHTAKCS